MSRHMRQQLRESRTFRRVVGFADAVADLGTHRICGTDAPYSRQMVYNVLYGRCGSRRLLERIVERRPDLLDLSFVSEATKAAARQIGDGVTWASLSDAQRYAEAVRSQASVNGFSTGRSGVFELTDSKGEKVRVNADDIIYLANGRIGDIGYGPAATQGTVRHETFHSLWRFIRGTLADADVQQLAKTLGIDVTQDGWEVTLDERMAHEMERYASGHYVSHAVSSRFDKMLDSWAGKIIDFFGQFGPSDEVTDPKTGKPYKLKDLYDKILRGELGTGALGVELAKLPAQPAETPAKEGAAKSAMPVKVTDADRAAQEAEAQAEAAATEPPAPEQPVPPVSPAATTVPAATSENPADAATPNQVYYRVGLPNSPVKLVGRLEVRDAESGVITSTDADYHDRGNQNRDDKSEESRALVEKIGANPDPLQVGTVQPMANNGIVWMLPNGDVIIGNHRVNGVRLGYEKGTAAELEKFVREDAAKRGIEIGADVKKPLMVFVLERIESPDGKADVHEVVRLANESQNRGFNIREQAGNDAKILQDNNLLPRIEFRADGRIDETKSGDAIGKFRQETGAQGMIAEDGSLTEEGQTRIQNAALAVLLGGEGNSALLNKIMTNAGRLDMQSELRALMKMTPELMALAESKPAYDLRVPLAEALQLFTEWRDKDETLRTAKDRSRHDWRERAKNGTRKRGLSWEAFMSQGDMFRTPSDEAKILGDLFARAESLRSFDREDVESEAGKKRVIDLISDYLTDYIKNARAVNTDTEDMFGGSPASRAEVLAAQRALDGEEGARFSIDGAYNPRSTIPNVRGGWNERKILRYLKANPSLHGVRTAARLISEFDTVDELKDHMFYHGTRNYVDKMQPSMTQSERWAQEHGGGGYGQRYWGISVSKSKKVASNFGNPSPGVSIYPVVLAKGAKVIDRPDLTDAADVEDHIVELWNDGVDAVRLGDWKSDHSEQELLVLNPRAICNIGTADSYRYFRLGSEENPLDIKDDAHIARMLEAAREYADYSPVKRFGKPVRPSLFYPSGTDGTIGEMKPREVIEAEKAQYEKDLAAWQESEQGIAAAEYEWKMRDTIRFSIADDYDYSTVPERLNESLQRISFDNETAADIAALRKAAERNIKAGADDTPSEMEARDLKRRINEANAMARERKRLAEEDPPNVDYYKKQETYYRENAKELREQLKELERNGIGEDRDEVDWYTNGDLLEILDAIESGEASSSMHFDPYAIGPGEAGPFAEALKNLADSENFKGKDLERLNRLAKKINDAYKEIERDIEDPRGPFGESLRYSVSTKGLSDAEKKDLHAAQTEAQRVLDQIGGTELGNSINRDFHGGAQVKSAADNNGDFSSHPDARYSIAGVFTGTAADYANSSRQGGKDDGPSLLKIGTGEGSQVYGWGLYGSTVRGVAEGYAGRDQRTKYTFDGKPIADAVRYGHDFMLDGKVLTGKAKLRAFVAETLSEQGGKEKAIRYLTTETQLPMRKSAIAEIEKNSERYGNGSGNIYEQTFFTDREPGDESHLLKWYEPVSKEQTEWIFTSMLPGHGNEFNKAIADYIASWRSKIKAAEKDPNAKKDLAYRAEQERGEDLYRVVEEALGSPKAASEFLARAGIDGVKYPVDSYGGKGVKDGDEAGWNYVSFRDDNIRVDHKWTDGQQRYSIAGVYTGTAADYANRSRYGGVDDGPSLLKIGTGEGSQVYGWGLYGSTERGIAEVYAGMGRRVGQMSYRLEDGARFFKSDDFANDKADRIIKDKLMSLEEGQTVDDAVAELRKSADKMRRKFRAKEAAEVYDKAAGALESVRDKVTLEWKKPDPSNIYEQTFFTDRAPGDESHLLKWYEPVSEEQRVWIIDGLKDLGGRKEVVDFVNRERQQDLDRDGLTWEAVEGEDMAPEYYPEDMLKDYLEQYLDLHSTGGELYDQLSDALGSPKAASEFLARAGIDGVKYPVDSYGKTVKDGDEAGWNYVSFRDDNIRVDHKWTDGQQRYSIAGSVSTEGLSETEKTNLRAAQTEAQRVLDQIGGTELGNSINRDFHGEARTTLIGKTIRTAKDLAALAQVYRNPCFETFRYIFTKNGEVVWQTGVTARLPGASATTVHTPRENTYAEIERMIAKVKPDGVWLLHNHPSGNVFPSRADINVTGELRTYFDRQGVIIDGHVIIDHDQYAEMNRWGDYNIRRMSAADLDASFHGNPFEKPTKDNAAFHDSLRESGEKFGLDNIAVFYARLQRMASERGKMLTFITVDSKANFVTSVANVPTETFDGTDDKRITDILADYRGATGGAFLFVVGDQSMDDYGMAAQQAIYRQIENGNVTDVLWQDASGKWGSARSYDPFIVDNKKVNRLIDSRTSRVNLGEARYSVSKELTEAMRKREIMQGIPVEGAVQPWPENFPKVMLQTTLASVKQKWPELHAKAKAGDREAALELVRNILGDEPSDGKRNKKWEKLRSLAAAHPNAIVVPVHAEEATGRNKIPAMYATMIERITGLRIGVDIVQSVRAFHTGANAVERMTRRAEFDGPVQSGAEYILVDDHVTQGGTLNELRKYIQSHGGKVVAITTLTASQFSDTMSISQEAIQALYAKFGNNLDEELKEAGIANGVAELTQSQARELRKLRADTLRDRLAQARLARQLELGARAVRYSTDSRAVSGATDLLPGLKDYLKPDGTSTETGTRWAKAKQFQRPIGRELNSLIDECLNAGDLSPEETAATLDRLISAAEATDEIRNGVLPNFRSDSALDDRTLFPIGEDGKPHPTPERKAVWDHIYKVLMADKITGENNEALETRKDGTAKETEIIVRANEGRPDLPPIPLKNPSYETRKDFRIDIIVGPPAAGKSSVFANALSVFYRSRVLDCDAVKKMLPGFNDGNGANYVHAESSKLNKDMIYDIQNRAEGDPRRGENVVLPVLGEDVEGLRKKIADWHAAGYTVYLHNNRVPILHAFGRALLRTLATGRWINPKVIKSCQDNPTRAYNILKKEADYYDQFSNDVTLGEKPIWEDGNYLDPAYGRSQGVRRSGGEGYSGVVRQAGASDLWAADSRGVDGRLGRNLRPASRNGQYILPGMEDQVLFSTEAPRSALVYPQLRGMSDEELLSAAVAARIALGKSDKVSDRSVKIGTVQNLMRRLHPDWDTTKIGVESMRVMSGAQKLAKRMREDIGRGVSESLILRHLPDAAHEQFGREMRQEAREGARLGAFGARANAALEERQARIVADAVRVQTGLDSGAIENAYGINLSETIMHLADNPLAEKDAPQGATGGGGGDASEQSASADGAEEPTAEIDAKVKAVVDDIVAASGRQAGSDERNRQNRRVAAGRDAENEAAMGGESEGDEGSAPADESAGEGDALAEAVKKSALDLENPRHLARFVAELARRQWVKEHHLAQDADVWRDLVAVQFLRKTAQSVYAKLCRDLVYSRSRETAMQRIARLDAVPTVAGLLSEMEFVGALINAQRIRDTQKQLCEKLDLFLRENFSAQGRFKPDKEEGKRKVSAEAELRARYMRHAMWLTPDAAAEEARQLQEALDALSVDFKDAGRERDQSREFVETIRKLNVLREFGALRYKPVGEIETAVQWWQDFARGESDDIVREMSDRDIRTKKAAHLLAVAFADPKRTTIREGGKADALNRFITGHMGFISLLQDCMRHASDADAAAVKDIIDYISREVQKAGDRSEAEKRRHNDAFHSAVESIYGKSFNAVMKAMMAPDERFTQFMGVVGGKRVTPTKGRALQLLVSLLQEGRKVQVEDEENPGQTKTVWEGGYHDNIVKHHREGQAAKIMRLLDPADMNMLKWLGQWYENNRSDLSGVCHSLFGIGVYAELPNYFPVKMMLETQGLEKGQGVGWTIFPKALTPRVRNERDFDTSADIFSMWASRMEEAAQWKHHAQLGLEMRGIFGRAELREAVRANHGASVDDLMQGFITDILAGHGAYDRSTAGVQYFSDQIRGWTALCALGGNIGVMAKQPTSIPAFGFEIGLVNTAKYMVSAFTPEGMAAMGKIWNSEQRRTRWNLGSSEAVRNALNQQGAGALKRMFQASMITNKLGDVVPALVVGQGIYRDCLDRGMSEEDAMAETWSIIERTQQSGRMENQTSIQRRNKLGRIMFQFLSTQQQYLQYELRAIREVIARPDSVRRWGGLGRAILLNHFILSSAYYWMGQLYKYALGQEPPEDELKDWIVTCLLGPYGSLFVAGFCCKYTLERAIKGYSIKGGSSMLPMESWLKNQINDGAKLVEAVCDSDGDTWDNMLEAAGRWMSDSNSTIRDLRKIYRYRVKGEPQRK